MAASRDGTSQAERLEAVADATVAGPGATDQASAGDLFSDKPPATSSPNSSDLDVERHGEKEASAKLQDTPPQRSALQIFFLMGSLCVSMVGISYDTEY